MTDFEAASLTLQAAAIIASTLIGLGQIGVVWFGIRRLVAANEARAHAGERQADIRSDLVDQQERESQSRHVETMVSLQAMIRNMDRQGQALDRQGRALQTVIARAAGEGRTSEAG